MKKLIKKIAFSALLLTFSFYTHAQTNDLFGQSFFSPRSQGTNSARYLIGQHPYMHNTDAKSCYGTMSATFEYLHAFKTRRLAEYFFGCDTIRFSGSSVTTREDNDILADYFGLSQTFDGTLRIDPNVKTFLCDLQLYCGMDSLCGGLYLFARAPIVWTRWCICLEENITNNGSGTPFPAGYMDSAAISAPAISIIKPLAGGLTFGHVSEGLTSGKIGCCCNKTGVADVEFGAGWDFIRRERGHCGINLRATAPTGSRPTGEFLFEPVIGNGRHWEFGVGLDGKVLLWEKNNDQKVFVNVVVNFTHLFNARQCRAFDFCDNGFGSRYMLLKEFDEHGAYAQNLVPAVNKTTLACDVRVDIQVEGTLMAGYHNKNWTVDFGYNGWIRSREKICIVGEIDKNKFGFKGIQNVTTPNENKTENSATLHGDPFDQQTNLYDTRSPIFIKTSDLDPCSASTPRSLTHKLFAHVSYAWDDEMDRRAIPYLGFGGEIEFEGVKVNESRPNKNSMSQFGIWCKAGLAF